MFEPDNSCLEMLLQYALHSNHRNNWLVREDGRLVENSKTVFDYQLAWALQRRMPERVRLLMQHGADVNRAVGGRSPYQWAKLGGDDTLADYLTNHGARRVELSDVDRLVRAIGDEHGETASALVDADPGLVARVEAAHPALMHEAAGEDRRAQVRLVLALGFDVNRITSRTPLHEAALHGHIDMARLLIEEGADPTIRDPYHHAPAIGWAQYNGKDEMVRFLTEQPLDLFAAIVFGGLDRIASLLDERPEQLDVAFGDFRGRGKPDTQYDWMTPLAFAVVNGRRDVAEFLVQNGANVKLRGPGGRSIRELARETGDSDLIQFVSEAASAQHRTWADRESTPPAGPGGVTHFSISCDSGNFAVARQIVACDHLDRENAAASGVLTTTL